MPAGIQMTLQKNPRCPIESAVALSCASNVARRSAARGGRAMGGLTYAQRLVDWGGVAVGVLIVGVAARLARESGSARPGSNYCCPAKRLHCVWGCWRWL